MTTWQDFINGAFEASAALAVLNHCRVLYRAKCYAGVSLLSTAFFWSWGLWNLYYYPHLGQWASFGGGVAIMLANFLWLALMLHFRSGAKASGDFLHANPSVTKSA